MAPMRCRHSRPPRRPGRRDGACPIVLSTCHERASTYAVTRSAAMSERPTGPVVTCIRCGRNADEATFHRDQREGAFDPTTGEVDRPHVSPHVLTMPRAEGDTDNWIRCDTIDLTVAGTEDDDLPHRWRCPKCGNADYEGVHRDYVGSNPANVEYGGSLGERWCSEGRPHRFSRARCRSDHPRRGSRDAGRHRGPDARSAGASWRTPPPRPRLLLRGLRLAGLSWPAGSSRTGTHE
jgi:hypothetical protein